MSPFNMQGSDLIMQDSDITMQELDLNIASNLAPEAQGSSSDQGALPQLRKRPFNGIQAAEEPTAKRLRYSAGHDMPQQPQMNAYHPMPQQRQARASYVAPPTFTTYVAPPAFPAYVSPPAFQENVAPPAFPERHSDLQESPMPQPTQTIQQHPIRRPRQARTQKRKDFKEDKEQQLQQLQRLVVSEQEKMERIRQLQSPPLTPEKKAELEGLFNVLEANRRQQQQLRSSDYLNLSQPRPPTSVHGVFQASATPQQQQTPLYCPAQAASLPVRGVFQASVTSQQQQTTSYHPVQPASISVRGVSQASATSQQQQTILYHSVQPTPAIPTPASVTSMTNSTTAKVPLSRGRVDSVITIDDDEPCTTEEQPSTEAPEAPHSCEGFVVPEAYTALFRYDDSGFPQQEAKMVRNKTLRTQRLEFAEEFSLAYSAGCMLHYTIANSVVSLLKTRDFGDMYDAISKHTSVDALRSIKYMRCELNKMHDFLLFTQSCADKKDQESVEKNKMKLKNGEKATPSTNTVDIKLEELRFEPKRCDLGFTVYSKAKESKAMKKGTCGADTTHDVTKYEVIDITVDDLMPKPLNLTRYQLMSDDEIKKEFLTKHLAQGYWHPIIADVVLGVAEMYQLDNWGREEARGMWRQADRHLKAIRLAQPKPTAPEPMDIHRLLRYSGKMLEHAKIISINLDWHAKDIAKHMKELTILRNSTDTRLSFRKMPERGACQLILRRALQGEGRDYRAEDKEVLQWLEGAEAVRTRAMLAEMEAALEKDEEELKDGGEREGYNDHDMVDSPMMVANEADEAEDLRVEELAAKLWAEFEEDEEGLNAGSKQEGHNDHEMLDMSMVAANETGKADDLRINALFEEDNEGNEDAQIAEENDYYENNEGNANDVNDDQGQEEQGPSTSYDDEFEESEEE